jgi:hypothetical protein
MSFDVSPFIVWPPMSNGLQHGFYFSQMHTSRAILSTNSAHQTLTAVTEILWANRFAIASGIRLFSGIKTILYKDAITQSYTFKYASSAPTF